MNKKEPLYEGLDAELYQAIIYSGGILAMVEALPPEAQQDEGIRDEVSQMRKLISRARLKAEQAKCSPALLKQLLRIEERLTAVLNG